MPDPIRISRIRRIQADGILGHYSPAAELPDFTDKALIYGFNGSGKSTLSRIFASLGKEGLCSLLPHRCEFTVELSDGRKIDARQSDGIADRIAVFNEDFVAENLNWTKAAANPVFFIGREQAQNAEKLEEATQALQRAEADSIRKAADEKQKCKAFDRLKTDQARNIAALLDLGRKYMAPDFTRDCEAHNESTSHLLPDHEIETVKTYIRSTAPLPKVLPVKVRTPAIEDVVGQTEGLLGQSISNLILQDLVGHESMLSWVQSGLQYHQEHNLTHCLFCANPVLGERLSDLRRLISSGIDKFLTEIDQRLATIRPLGEEIDKASRELPRPSEVSPDKRREYSELIEQLATLGQQARQVLDVCAEQLVRKKDSPHRQVVLPEETFRKFNKTEWEREYWQVLERLNEIIDLHNKTFDDFETSKNREKDRYKKHIIQSAIHEYVERKNDAELAKKVHSDAQVRVDDLRKEVSTLQQSLRKHSIAAESINNGIRGYLGHSELEFRALDEGYEITRNGKSLQGPLSEGERTAIALCYFLVTLNADGRNVQNCIVVLDDPISSLDTRALNYALAMIKSVCHVSNQLIIMTHNLHFMNEVKKWIRRNRDTDDKKLYFLKVTMEAKDGSRSARLESMPKFIREYESEYQYLFHLVKEFVDSSGVDHSFFYILPNALRKLLEIFLAFKIPGSYGLKGKLEKLAKSHQSLDPVQITALERLVQLESHADNLDDLVSISSLTVEEIHQASIALFGIIEEIDGEHFQQMQQICR